MRFELLHKGSLSQALSAAEAIFPLQEDRDSIKKAYNQFLFTNPLYYSENFKAYIRQVFFGLWSLGPSMLGISGLYRYETLPDQYWLGWFGIVPEFRRMGYGTKVVSHHCNIIKSLGGRSISVFTSDAPNGTVFKFYEQMGFEKIEKIEWRRSKEFALRKQL